MDVNFTRIPIIFFAAFLFGLEPQPGAVASGAEVFYLARRSEALAELSLEADALAHTY